MALRIFIHLDSSTSESPTKIIQGMKIARVTYFDKFCTLELTKCASRAFESDVGTTTKFTLKNGAAELDDLAC